MPDDQQPSSIDGVLRRPFPEQIAYFRRKLGNRVPTARWDDIEREAHDGAFMVAGAAKADLLSDLGAAVDRSITEGTGLEAFRKDFRNIVERNGWHGWTGEGTKKGEAWRTRVIYRTNASVSYAAGRNAQLVEGNFAFWIYRHSGSEHPRLHHLSWDGIVLPADHPFWLTHSAPNGWGCACYILGARSEKGARRLGGQPGKKLPQGWNARDPKTGTPPGIGKGWDYAPGASVANTIRQMAAKTVQWEYELAKSYMQSLPPKNRDALSTSLRELPSLKDDVRGYARASIDGRETTPYRTLGLATSDQAKRVAALKAGRDVGGYDFTIDQSGVRHAYRMHGAGNEALRGQRAITASDFSLLPSIINAPDAMEDAGLSRAGTPLLRLTKRINGETFVAVFAIRTKRRSLALQSMWIR